MIVDYTAIINRTIDLLRGEFGSEISEYRFGELSKGNFANSYPAVFVTTEPAPYQTLENTGSVAGGVLQTLIRTQIGIMVNEASPELAKKSLLKTLERMLKVVRENPRLLKNGADPLLVRSTINTIQEDGESRGNTTQSAVINIQSQVGSQWKLTIDGMVLDLLSKPLESPGIRLDKDLMDDAVQMWTPIDKEGQLHVEYEDTPVIHSAIQALVDAWNEIPVVVHVGNATRNYTVVLQNPQASAPFDQIERVTLSMNLVR